MAAATTPLEPSFDACDQFFSIPELVTLFLEQASTRALVHCQRVCRTWKTIIQASETLQQHLFLQAAPADSKPIINPLIDECFAILADSSSCIATGTGNHNPDSGYRLYKDLIHLPWAQDGKLEHAPARRAYARADASWRNMLSSQPPIRRLDWWHTHSPPGHFEEGWGHQDMNDCNVDLGMLWDLAESRMARGCSVRVLYFPKGKSVDNESSCSEAVEWWRSGSGNRRGLTDNMPRVEIQSRQHWEKSVTGREVFDMKTLRWVGPEGTQRGRHNYERDGFNVLRNDCRRDHEGVCEGQLVHGREQNPLGRWSRSEGFTWAELDGESSGHG